MIPENSIKELPFISVIIPFFNNQDEVIRIEQTLLHQTYPSERFEIIFIDNGSDKDFTFEDSFLTRNTLLTEREYLNSPYSARNRGIEASKGEIIVFIDANSVPENDWLEKGVECFRNSKRDLIGGEVDFDFQNQVTAGKIVDALTSINMKRAVQTRGAAYTANLFVKRMIFESVGFFEEGVRSGGDIRWTLRAKENGFKIAYCGQAVVKKYARSYKELYRKKIRTGKGYFYTWEKESKKEKKSWTYNLFRSLKPPTFAKIRKMNPERYKESFDQKRLAVWFHFYVLGIVQQMAFIVEYFRAQFHR